MDRADLFAQKDGLLDKPELRNLKLLLGINIFLLITSYLMPQYFGVHLGWDITCTRFANILLCAYGIMHAKVFNSFSNIVMRCSMTIPLVLYLLVALYTMVFRVDINALMLVFLEILTCYMLLFAIRYVIGIRRTIRLINFCAYFLGLYGFVEFAARQSLYLKFLRTVPTLVTNCYRSGYYRIMGPCGHPLGYGLLLILFIATACIDENKGEMFLYKRPILLVLLVANVFLTGSRSSQGIAAIEVICILIFSNHANRKKSIFYSIVLILGAALFVLATYNTSIGRYIMMQITTLIDQAFDTELSVYYGADIETLKNSEGYRTFLPYIFTLDWLNPLIGRGVKGGDFSAEVYDKYGNVAYLNSIDNYYISQYIKYAYPGLVFYVLFILVTGISMIRNYLKTKSEVIKALFIGFCCYFYNLWWLDALQTLKFMYTVVALFYAVTFAIEDNAKLELKEKGQCEGEKG